MSVKAMIFIDGSWLYHSRQALFDALGENNGFEIDYNRIPDIIAQTIAENLGIDVDLIRTNYFGTIPVNKQSFNPTKQMAFYDFLAMQCGYDTEIIPIDFRKDPEAKPDDKWVDVALTASLMHYAMTPGAFDIAVLVAGNADYVPALRRVRALGKRVFLVAMNSLNNKQLTSVTLLTSPGLLDFPPLFLDQHSEEIRLVRSEQLRACKTCGREESTTWAGPEFFCSACRNEHHKGVIRACEVCGVEEETTWDKPGYLCATCRKVPKKEPKEPKDKE